MHDAPSPLRGAADDENAAYCAIAVMAKAPRPGRCKTRLTPPLAPDQAAALSAAFLRDTTENIVTAGHAQKIHPWAAYAPAGSEHLFDGHLAHGTRLVLADGEIDAPPAVNGTAGTGPGAAAIESVPLYDKSFVEYVAIWLAETYANPAVTIAFVPASG